ncbi:MAG: DUF4157 domain-containing protein [Blastocatellia bacterium]
MNKLSGIHMKSEAMPAAAFRPARSIFLQKKCDCGGPAGVTGECAECNSKQFALQRNFTNQPEPSMVRQIFNVALPSSGQPLDQATSGFMEPRFGHDFSQVRVHTGGQADESAKRVNALAYTVGRDIVFGEGQYVPGTTSGKRILAHELAHIVQQQHTSATHSPAFITSAYDSAEAEADSVADRIADERPLMPVKQRRGPALMRKLRVDRPAESIPNPGPQASAQTKAEVVQGYLRMLSQSGSPTVNQTSGEVSMGTGYCPGVLGGLVQGAKAAYGVGHDIGSVGGRIPLLGPLIGGLFGIFGAIGGAVAGLFGSEMVSPTGASSTPAGSSCLCDFMDFKNVWTIEINDKEPPATFNKRVRVPSPNSPLLWGAANVSGQLVNHQPWLLLGHELCGHAWIEERQKGDVNDEGENEAPTVLRDPETGKVSMGAEPRAEQFLRHGRSVERENLIRKEHGIEARGFRLREPYCGESFSRESTSPQGPVEWQKLGRGSGFDTYLDTCQYLREQLPESKTRKYRIDERIP